jgi:hypothetical protein
MHRIELPKPNVPIPGLTVYSDTPHELIAVFPSLPGAETITAKRTVISIPPLNQLYVVNFHGAMFATRELTVTVHPDTSLKKVDLNVETTLSDQLDKLSESVSTLATARKEIRDQKREEQKEARDREKELKDEAKAQDPLALENEAIKRELLNLMLKANRDAAQRGAELPYPGIGI